MEFSGLFEGRFKLLGPLGKDEIGATFLVEDQNSGKQAALRKLGNSIALIIKHMAGNMRSRWRDFLASDAEKLDRNRDQEFVVVSSDTQRSLLERWEEAWELLFETPRSLDPKDLDATVLIRTEPHLVVQVINREVIHYAYHVGQIVFLAKHSAGDRWQPLTIPSGQSDEFNANPKPYLTEP